MPTLRQSYQPLSDTILGEVRELRRLKIHSSVRLPGSVSDVVSRYRTCQWRLLPTFTRTLLSLQTFAQPRTSMQHRSRSPNSLLTTYRLRRFLQNNGPCSGHAPFLIASLARLRGLMPSGWSVDQRHNYLVDMLSGLENEPFACEVAHDSLRLADYPNSNGWRLIEEDAFSGPALERELARANIVLCNPPFGDFSEQERASIRGVGRPNKAAEALRRVLEHPPAMLGFVLPRSFTQGALYEPLRKRLAEVYPQTFLLVLPDIAFQHSEAETVLVIAHDERKAENIHRSE